MLIKSENIFLDVKGKTKYDIIRNMINSSTIEEGLKEYAYEKVKEREELQPTSVGNGIGIAHAKIEKIKELDILVGVLKKGVDYDAYDDKPVNIIFVILSPVENNREYLSVLSKISRFCRKENMIENIIQENNREYIIDLFSQLGS
ncbi:MAG: PTS system fructose-specific EIIABC component [bacterium ADurb.Bin363]|nr:MAG: PTS system fructose-specific EIIABC component [bacterium ADurb.Bin363]